jgi:type IV fimbrial biogenesis protein FimT
MLGAARQRGFNIIEMIVTMAVLGVIIAVALPSAADWIRNTRVRNVAESARNGLQKARAEALSRNTVVTFWMMSPSATGSLDSTCAPSSASASWVISMDDPSGQCNAVASSTDAPRLIEAFGAGAGATGMNVKGVDTNGAPVNAVSFNGYGQPVQTGTPPLPLAKIDIDITGTRHLEVQISTGGGIRMCDRDVTAPGDPRACT